MQHVESVATVLSCDFMQMQIGDAGEWEDHCRGLRQNQSALNYTLVLHMWVAQHSHDNLIRWLTLC